MQQQPAVKYQLFLFFLNFLSIHFSLSAIGEVVTTTGAEGVFPGVEGAAATTAAAVPNRNQRVQTTARPTKRVTTMRRISSTTRRSSSTAKTNQVKNIPQANVKTTKKPQSSVRPKS